MAVSGTPRIGRAAPWVLAVVVGLVGAWLGTLVLARAEVPMGPFRVAVQAGFGPSVTEIGLPPFGRVVADTHAAPLEVSATLVDVGVERLSDVVSRVGTDGLVRQVERDALDELRRLAARLVVVSAIGAIVLGVLVFRTDWRKVVVSGLTAVFTVMAIEGLALATYRPAAFTEPTYTGSLGPAARLIGPVREATDRIEDFRAGLQVLIEGATRAYTSIQGQPSVGEDVVRVLHISDVHSSFLGMDFASEVARAFDVDLVIDTGDMTSFATTIENVIATRIPEFGRPYLWVRGNHDPRSLQSEVAGTESAVVLDGDEVELDGVTIYGLGHPAFAPAGSPEETDPDAFEDEARAATPVIAEDLSELEDPPDILAVHDDRMVEALAGRFPLVISGHFHETRARVIDGTLFLRIGTTGGNGAGVFRGLDVPFSAEVLYLSRDPEVGLVAYDVIEQFPDTGSLTVTRHLVSEEYGELVPSPSPTASPTITPTVTPTPSG